MGKHKDKIKKHEKHKKKERKRKSSTESNSEDEWVEKCPETPTNDSKHQREDWMSLSTNFTSKSNLDYRREREQNKKLDRERAVYNPGECSRELNPYWKNGGDGLPNIEKFKKPSNVDFNYRSRSVTSSSWRKNPSCDADVKHQENKIAQTSKNSQDVKEVYSQKELNVLAAKLLKAEIMGDTSLISQLKNKLEDARKFCGTDEKHDDGVILTMTDSKGYSRPVIPSHCSGTSQNKRKKQKVETHSDGQRSRYFADDDKYSLKQMFENEKFNSVADQNIQFMKLAGKVRKNDDLDDVFTDDIRRKESDDKQHKKTKYKAINEHQRMSQSLDNCKWCLQSERMSKHLMVSFGDTMYLSLPHFEPLTDGHCLIVPVRHTPCSTQLDENEWLELMNFRKALCQMFRSLGKDVIFFESAITLGRFPHMFIECVPLPQEQGDLAPIYFKKAIDESEKEWATNKKLISLAGRDVRKAVPKGLPYFSVLFGMNEGYAHIVEDQRYFPNNFAQEIIGGMLDLDHSKWRKPKPQNFEEQSKRVLDFSKIWCDYDCTK